jgi:hypothetical protein
LGLSPLLACAAAQYQRDGFVVLRQHLGAARLSELRNAVSDTMAACQMSTNTSFLLSLAHEAGLHDGVSVLGSWLASDVVPVVQALLRQRSASYSDEGQTPPLLRHGHLSLLLGGGGQPYCQPPHKDCHWWFHGITPGSANEEAIGRLCHCRLVNYSAPLLAAADAFLT